MACVRGPTDAPSDDKLGGAMGEAMLPMLPTVLEAGGEPKVAVEPALVAP